VSNFYKDNPDIRFHLENKNLKRIVTLIEDEFADRDTYSFAPGDVEDALDNYDRVLEIVGDISGDFIAPRAREVDKEGVRFENGEVHYPKGIREAVDLLNKADLAGFTLPRKYGGINMPQTVFCAAVEMLARADASTMLAFGVQALGETIAKFGSDDQKDRYLPRFASGEINGSMALTEPDSGSDLQSVMFRANEKDEGGWLLNGVKRFITNGCGDISLVMARSEEGSTGGRGLSIFIYERDEKMKIRRIEHKLGIKGSPTCELQFNNAEAELLGKRKFGLIRYTMYLMNGARLAVAAQAVGIAEAAYREADKYAKYRFQFKKAIREIPAVYEMLTNIKIDIEAARVLLYETSRIVDIREGIEKRMEVHPETRDELKRELKRYEKFVSLYTPLVKGYAAEMANRVCSDAIQIHGGVGYTCDFNVERHYRDARITNIYEGTTQLQVVSAIGGIISGVVSERLNEYEAENDFSEVGDLITIARELRSAMETAISHMREKKDPVFQEYHAGRIVAIATETIVSYLLCADAIRSDRKKKLARVYIPKALLKMKSNLEYILSYDSILILHHEDLLNTME